MSPTRSWPRFRPLGRYRLQTEVGGELVTVQSERDSCDLNVLMAKYLKQGQPLPPSVKVGRYGDFSEVGEYLDALDRIEMAEAQFASLPSAARDRFKNSAAEFLRELPALSLDEANDLGLLREEASSRIAQRKAAELAKAAAAAAPSPSPPPPPGVPPAKP